MKVRKGIFETNSSSSHSIVFSDEDVILDSLEHNGRVVLERSDFGWEEETHYDAFTKSSYAFTYISNLTDYKKRERAASMLRSVIKRRHPDADIVFDEDSQGYIDHQSADVCAAAFESMDKLYNFIFNQKTKLEIDNDNH